MEFLITIDDKYTEPALLLMFSVYKNMGRNHLFYFIHRDITEENQNRIREYAQKVCGSEVRFVLFCDERLSDLPTHGAWRHEVYFRLFAAYLIPDIDYVVYLDGDTLVTGNLQNAWNTLLLEKRAIGGVPNDIQSEHKERLSLSNDAVYINAGVLFMNLKRIRELYSEQEIWDMLFSLSSKLMFQDQDFINIVFRDEMFILDIRYNYMISLIERVNSYPRIKDSIICHYVLAKPWDEEFLFATDRVYLKYLAVSGQPIRALYLLYQHRKRRWGTKLKSYLKMK